MDVKLIFAAKDGGPFYIKGNEGHFHTSRLGFLPSDFCTSSEV